MNRNRLRSILSDYKNGHSSLEETVSLVEQNSDSPASPVQQVQSKIAQTIMLSCQELDICDQRTAALLAARVTVQLSDMH